MDIKDLIAGNIVKCKISNDGGIYKVVAIDGYSHKVMLDGARFKEWISVDKIKPIPISSKNIILSGGKKHNKKYFFYLNNHEHDVDKISFYVSEGFLCFEGIKYRSLFKHISYVHQMQNLYYALTGRDLECVV